MGVPTMYARLLEAYDAMPPEQQRAAAAAAAALRLTISGSSACPLPIMQRWQELSGTPLLERYGMTEIGMALSNPLQVGGAGLARLAAGCCLRAWAAAAMAR
jgi:malonyl-CoA/methylmalonyl-CoA synthetase